MGYYVNLKEKPKETWLRENGERVWTAIWPTDNNLALVCLVFNGAWTAAAICYSKDEMNAFRDPLDTRYKIWYHIKKTLLLETSDITLKDFRE